MSIKRRDFLKIAGGISLSLPFYQCSLDRLPSSADKGWLSGLEQWIPTVCQACPGGCGILVRVIDDRAVKVEGNPLHPLNQGRVCPKGQAGLQLLYSPNRIRTPLKKQGERGSEKWQAISWEEALDTVTSKLLELRNSGKSHTVAFIGQDYQNTTEDLIKRFLEVYGTPNYIKLDDWSTLKKSYSLTQGISDLLALDLENSKYVLSFGADFLANWPTSMENQRIYGGKRANRDIKIIQIEPRFSLCASRADSWIPINPGTEGLLALGISSVIVKEELYNEAFLTRFAAGFDDFKNAILREIRLDHISELTGVPLRQIIEVAKEFSTIQPAVAVADYNLTYHSKGLFTALAIHSLNALVGNIDIPGGLLRQRRAPLREMPVKLLDEVAKRGISEPRIDETSEGKLSIDNDETRNFVENVVGRSPYEINCLFLPSGDEFITSLLSKKMEEAIQKIPFVVSFASFLDELNESVDLVLPDTTYFEKWQEHQASPLSKVPVVGINQPIVEPLYQTKAFEDVILTLAKKIDPSQSQNFPWRSFKELLLFRLEGLFEAKRGGVFSSPLEKAQLRLLEERGWWVPQHASLDSFMKDLKDKGGWQDPSYHFNERSFIYQNSSRRFEFPAFPQTQEFLPQFSGKESEYPFLLYLYELPFASVENGANMPWHQETIGFRFRLNWKIWIEINLETAEKLGIHDKDLVWVESPHGRIKAVAKIFPGIIPDAVSIPLGKTEDFLGQKKLERKNDPLVLVKGAYAEGRGKYSRHSTRVKIYKYTE